MAADLKSLGVLMCAMLCAGIVVGEELPDPTRPAVELVPRLDSGEAVAPPLAPAGLQSVILSGKREAAIINGTEVERGKKYGDAVLTVVNETCVVLLGPQGRQVMHLYPTVNLSKTELACTGRNGLSTIHKAASSATVEKNNQKNNQTGREESHNLWL